MSKNIKKAITISVIVIVIIIAIISTFFIVKHFANKRKVDSVCEIYSDNNVQERIDNCTNNDDLKLKIDGETVIGVIEIDKIGFKGLIYEGTTLKTLDKGVGHFDNSSYLNGNVCLAAHNSSNYWAKLYTLENGDKITYTSFLGTKKYKVNSITQISATDWSKLEKSNENILTLLTCVRKQPDQRLCVQALEEK